MLMLSTVAGGKADLAERIVKAGFLGRLCQLLVVLQAPVSALRTTRPPLTFGTQ